MTMHSKASLHQRLARLEAAASRAGESDPCLCAGRPAWVFIDDGEPMPDAAALVCPRCHGNISVGLIIEDPNFFSNAWVHEHEQNDEPPPLPAPQSSPPG